MSLQVQIHKELQEIRRKIEKTKRPERKAKLIRDYVDLLETIEID